MRVSDCALVIIRDDGCSVFGCVEDFPHRLAKVESLLGGVCCTIVLCLASGLGEADC
jgi:hypothetical protein